MTRWPDGLDAGARQVLELLEQAQAQGSPKIHEGSPDEGREIYLRSRYALGPDAPEVGGVEELLLAPERPEGGIPARLYRPLEPAAGLPSPALVYYHGGGWVIGDLETHDVVCRELANLAGIPVVSVAYRLAPEHPFPAPVQDAVAAFDAVLAEGEALGIDPERVAVGGDSAGGNLAAVVSLIARDRVRAGGAGSPRLQVLLYPATNMHRETVSHREFGEILLTSESQEWFQRHYLPRPEDRSDWRASPLLAPEVAGVAPAWILVAGFDPLRDEALSYARRLEAAGVPTEVREFPGQIHGFLTMGAAIPEAGLALREIAGALRRGLL